MPKLQLNSKFVNNMLPEWGRFVTAIKLNRGLRESNYNQLLAYLKQHEAHAKENKMVLERLSQPIANPLVLLSNVSNTQHGLPSSSTSSITPLTPPQPFSLKPTINSEHLPIQGTPNRGQGMNPWGGNAAGYGEAQNRVGNVNQGQEEHVMHNSVQLDHVVDLHADHTSFSNMIPYDQEQVELYERRAKFELTECEQKINDQLRLVISDHNFKEETLKRELHSTKLQLTSTINRNKSMVEDRLVKQDQSLQTVHMLCRPRPLYNDLNKVAIGYKNPLCLTRPKQAQPALYNGHEILKDNHARAKVHNTEDTLEIVEITRKKMNAKMTDPECVTHKVKIAPYDYSKENLLATFTPQKQLTPEQIYWSNDLMKLKSEALKERAKQVK
nr:hypothetical protein [Tanacetum cinerariifolium]